MTRVIISSAVVLACLGCAGPAFTTRTIQRESSWFVGLLSYAEPAKAAVVHHDHPADWSEQDLHEVLGRVLLQEHIGLLDPARPPRAVFSQEDTAPLVPALRSAFREARPSEWIVFFLARPSGDGQEITSGGFSLMDKRLHVIIANYHEQVLPGSESAEAIHANPIRSIRGTGGSLTFDPSRFVVASQANWMAGSSGRSASELIVDHQAFLAAASSPGGMFTRSSAQPSDSDLLSLRNEVQRLREEVARLRAQLEAQSDELVRLKSRQTPEASAHPSPPRKPVR